jgi:hypothetical protein
VALPGHQRVHRHQLERRIAAHPDLRPHREYALLTAEPGNQDRRVALARLARRRHLSFCGHTATTPPLPLNKARQPSPSISLTVARAAGMSLKPR